ncbi:MAG: c-type cytochrome [Chloroflexi bacterium]|nr:c-type cytochrome [Chloroflexota bacterium]
MRRLIPFLALVAGIVLLLAAQVAMAQDGHGDGPAEGGEGEQGEQGDELAALRGAAVFAEFCQACHAPGGAAMVAGAAFEAGGVEKAREVVENGYQPDEPGGLAMPAYDKLLDDEQVDDLIAYLETWATGEIPPLPEPNIDVKLEQVPDYFGDPAAGAVIYAKSCNGCHGPEGKGRLKPDFPGFEFSADTRLIVRDSHIPAFGTAAGGSLSDEQLVDLETYMASWSLSEKKEPASAEGINVLMVVMGIGAIVIVGAAYISRMIFTE